MKRALSLWFLTGILFFLIGSCGDNHDTRFTHRSWSDVQEVPLLDSLNLENFISKREGKLLLLNVWATWCIPCREEFPALVKLNQKYHHNKVQIIGISADYPDEVEEKVLPFLRQQKVNFPVYVQNFSRQENFINLMNTGWSGALPATFVFDSSGVQRHFVVGKQSYQDFAGLLDDL